MNFELPYKRYGIFTNNHEIALEIFEDIYEKNKDLVVRYLKSSNRLFIELNDKTTYRWFICNDCVRGYRFTEVAIDRNSVTNEYIANRIYPSLIYSKDIRNDIHYIEFDEETHKIYIK